MQTASDRRPSHTASLLSHRSMLCNTSQSGSFMGVSLADLERFLCMVIIGLSEKLSEIKYLNFVRWKETGSSQDCWTVCNSIWWRVRDCYYSLGFIILIGIIGNAYAKKTTKLWTALWGTINSTFWSWNHAFKRCEPFIIQQRENKRIESGKVTTRWI